MSVGLGKNSLVADGGIGAGSAEGGKEPPPVQDVGSISRRSW